MIPILISPGLLSFLPHRGTRLPASPPPCTAAFERHARIASPQPLLRAHQVTRQRSGQASVDSPPCPTPVARSYHMTQVPTLPLNA